MKKKVILCVSDFGNSGIAESARVPMKRWHEQGHELWQLGIGYTGWATNVDREAYPWADRMLPVSGYADHERFGQQAIAKALQVSKPDIVFTTFDVWMIDYIQRPEASAFLTPEAKEMLSHANRTFKHLAYFPLDGAVRGKHLPLGMDEAIFAMDVPVTYSRFAQKVIRDSTNIEVPFIPIGHDPSVFKPGDKIEARKMLGLPKDRFIVGMVGTNQYRKLWGEFFDLVTPFAKKHEDALIIPFTTWDSKIAGGAEVSDLVWRSGIERQILRPEEMVGKLTDPGMAAFYQSLDVLVLCTAGEGAGLPPIRARACGIPVLVSANTSNVEFCGSSFEAVPCNGTHFDSFGSNLERYSTNISEMGVRLEKLYNSPLFAADIASRGYQETKQYEIGTVGLQWDALLESL